MHILDLPPELLQLTIDVAVLHTDLQCALRFQETCRTLPQNSGQTPSLTHHRRLQRNRKEVNIPLTEGRASPDATVRVYDTGSYSLEDAPWEC